MEQTTQNSEYCRFSRLAPLVSSPTCHRRKIKGMWGVVKFVPIACGTGYQLIDPGFEYELSMRFP